DGAPTPADTTANTGNGTASYENQSFGFDLSYTSGTDTFEFVITRPDTTTSTISLPAPGIDQLNTLSLSTSGSRGAVSLTGVEFSGGAFFVDAFPNVDTAPGGPTFAETFLYFGDTANLTSFDWSLSGDLSFGSFTRSNPSEGSKLTVRIIDTIPAPGTAAMLGLGGLVASRRRR
ncbi:MAG: PEP-CTERM sorting domain-containing protein, partial [Planctomycetota bacterium]